MWAWLFIYSLTGFSLILDKRKKKKLFSPKHVGKNVAEEQREFYMEGREASISGNAGRNWKENLNPPELLPTAAFCPGRGSNSGPQHLCLRSPETRMAVPAIQRDGFCGPVWERTTTIPQNINSMKISFQIPRFWFIKASWDITH